MIAWIFAGGGDAEMAIKPWLENHFPNATFLQKTPYRTKPAPRPGAPSREVQGGLTGKDLRSKIKFLWKNYSDSVKPDIIIVVDDTDCEVPSEEKEKHRENVREILGSESQTCVTIALAVPELEAWILADWQSTFGKNHKNCQIELRLALIKAGVDFDRLETFDCHCGKHDYRKISTTLAECFKLLCGTNYSKAKDTPELLEQTDPERIAERCPHFKEFWTELRNCIGTPNQ